MAFHEGGKSKEICTREALDAPRMEDDNGREGEARDWRRGRPKAQFTRYVLAHVHCEHVLKEIV